MATTVTITLVKADSALSMETLLWKYGNATEGIDNFKQVYNTKSDHTNNSLDASIINNSWDARTDEVVDIMKEFVTSVTPSPSTQPYTQKAIQLTLSSRWNGNQTALASLVKKYVLDGMMSDWLAVTAPSEAPMFSTKLADDEIRINKEIYTKKQPQ